MDEMEMIADFTDSADANVRNGGAADFEDAQPDGDGFDAPDGEGDWGLDDTPDNLPEAPPPERFTLRHLGREHEVTREEVIALAQKGRDYDRIRERLIRLESGGEAAAPGRREMLRNVHDFISEYGGGIDPATIPDEVWTDVRAGTPLVVAYQRFENRALNEQLRGRQNTARAAGATRSAGERGADTGIESDWYSD